MLYFFVEIEKNIKAPFARIGKNYGIIDNYSVTEVKRNT